MQSAPTNPISVEADGTSEQQLSLKMFQLMRLPQPNGSSIWWPCVLFENEVQLLHFHHVYGDLLLDSGATLQKSKDLLQFMMQHMDQYDQVPVALLLGPSSCDATQGQPRAYYQPDPRTLTTLGEKLHHFLALDMAGVKATIQTLQTLYLTCLTGSSAESETTNDEPETNSALPETTADAATVEHATMEHVRVEPAQERMEEPETNSILPEPTTEANVENVPDQEPTQERMENTVDSPQQSMEESTSGTVGSSTSKSSSSKESVSVLESIAASSSSSRRRRRRTTRVPPSSHKKKMTTKNCSSTAKKSKKKRAVAKFSSPSDSLGRKRNEASGGQVQFRDVAKLLRKGGYVVEHNRYGLPGKDASDTSLQLNQDFFTNLDLFRAHLCQRGVEDRGDAWTVEERQEIHDWVRGAIVASDQTFDADMLRNNKAVTLLLQLGFAHRDSGFQSYYVYPHIQEGYLNKNTFETEKDLFVHLAKHGLPETCDFDAISNKDRQSLELFLTTQVDVTETFVRPVDHMDSDSLSVRSKRRREPDMLISFVNKRKRASNTPKLSHRSPASAAKTTDSSSSGSSYKSCSSTTAPPPTTKENTAAESLGISEEILDCESEPKFLPLLTQHEPADSSDHELLLTQDIMESPSASAASLKRSPRLSPNYGHEEQGGSVASLRRSSPRLSKKYGHEEQDFFADETNNQENTPIPTKQLDRTFASAALGQSSNKPLQSVPTVLEENSTFVDSPPLGTNQFSSVSTVVTCNSSPGNAPRRSDKERLSDSLAELDMNKSIARPFFASGATARSPFALNMEEVQTYVKRAVEDAHDTSRKPLYVCGVPGIGKTTGVLWCCREAIQNNENMEQELRLCHINASHLATCGDIGSFLCNRIIQDASTKRKPRSFDTFLKSEESPLMIVVLDEMDSLISSTSTLEPPSTASEGALYQLLEWTTNHPHKIVLIGISNSTGNKKFSRLQMMRKLQVVTFAAYNSTDLECILEGRIGPNIMEKKAMEYIAKVVANGAGDARKALEFASAAIKSCYEALPELGEDEQECYSSTPLVTLRHVLAIQSCQNKQYPDIIRGLPDDGQLALCILSTLVQGGVSVTTYGKLRAFVVRCMEYRSGGDPMSSADFKDMLETMEDSSLIQLGNDGKRANKHNVLDLHDMPICIHGHATDISKAVQSVMGKTPFYQRVVSAVKENIHELL